MNMDSYLSAFILGCFSALLWSQLPSLALLACLMAVVLLFCYWISTSRFSSTSLPSYLSKLLLSLLLGVSWMASVGHWHSHWQLPERFYQQTVILEGQVETLIGAAPPYKIQILVAKINNETFYFKPRVRLSWHHFSAANTTTSHLQPDKLKQGQTVRLVAKLKAPRGLKNQFSFDFQQWLFSQNIKATGYIKESKLNQILVIRSAIRQALFDEIQRFDLDSAGWVMALGLGYRDMLTKSDWQLLQATGTAHLIAVSGLHLGVVAGFAFILIKALLRLALPYLSVSHSYNFHRVALWSCVVIAGLYAHLAGLAIPTIRAWLLLCIVAVLLHFRIALGRLRVLQLCAVCFLLLLPLSIFTLSFWLSFAAMLTVIFALWLWPNNSTENSLPSGVSPAQGSRVVAEPSGARQYKGRAVGAKLWRWCVISLRLQALFSVVLMPLIAWQMQFISVIAPLVNFVAVPLVTLLLLPLALFVVVLAGLSSIAPQVISYAAISTFLNVIDAVFLTAIAGLQYAASWSAAMIELPAIPFSIWVLLLVICIWAFFPRRLGCVLRGFSLLLLLPAMTYMLDAKPKWQVRVLDVGQGLAVLITHNNRAVLYDTGIGFGDGFNMADTVIVPTLKGVGIAKLDLMIVSHNDNDHSGNAQKLMDSGIADKVLSSQFQPAQLCEQGMSWQWQGLQFDILWPAVTHSNLIASAPFRHSESLLSDNNQSCVVRVSNGEVSFWLTGDIEHEAESQIAAYLREGITADLQQSLSNTKTNVLIAPHHGSRTSSSRRFLELINPDIAVFSAGFQNRWGMPHDEVVQRYRNMQIATYSTGTSGEVIFTVNEGAASETPSYKQTTLEIQQVRYDIRGRWYATMPQ